ncbi:MAG: hypothetical protein V1816_15495 [Pseudomonadota bacterium]
MAEKKLDEKLRRILKKDAGYSDEDLAVIEGNPRQREIMEALPVLFRKKMVFTCVSAENCTYNKVGDRYVFNAFGGMIKDETCKVPCLWALGSFFPFCYMVYDRAASGLDPAGLHLDHVRCPDTGCRRGGFGSSLFKMTMEDL